MASHRPVAGIVLMCLLGWSLPAEAKEFEITEVAPGIFTGPSPESDADYCRLQRLGIRTVIDSQVYRPLASKREQREVCRRGMTYVHIPIDFRPTDDGSPHRVLSLLAQSDRQPIYLHCHLGRDRTGLVIALYRVHYLGWTASAAYAAMETQQYNPMLRDMDRYFWRSVQ